MSHSLSWAHGSLEVEPLGGMVGPLEFHLPHGRRFQPFAIASWSAPEGESGGAFAAVPGHLHRLRGAFPCLPFGTGGRPRDLAAEWRPGFEAAAMTDEPHGHCSNHPWTLEEAEAGALALSIAYPEAHAVESLRQVLRPDPAGPALTLEVEIRARRAFTLPFGQHFILRLPDPPGRLRLRPPPFAQGFTYPGVVEPGAMATEPARRFAGLDAVPGAGGGTLDMTRLPLPGRIEDVVLLTGLQGAFVALYPDEGAGLKIAWDQEALPSCLLWFSQGALTEFPWNGRFLGLGIEPLAAAFDLSDRVSAGDNPLRREGIATALSLPAGGRRTLRFTLTAFALG